MTRHSYKPVGICPKRFGFEIVDGRIRNLVIEGGCDGNLKGLARLVDNEPAAKVADLLAGITCGRKPSSCPDQLSTALRKVLARTGKAASVKTPVVAGMPKADPNGGGIPMADLTAIKPKTPGDVKAGKVAGSGQAKKTRPGV
ncbi:MAG: TIGR03905 family TSCPD domain-containing protein [Deltaproteobacteria bacterium]|nr:TIGR03905 family TSCPD domain-containing protein [Deltaproteobacteria bacterium]